MPEVDRSFMVTIWVNAAYCITQSVLKRVVPSVSYPNQQEVTTMAHYCKHCVNSPSKVLQNAVKFFGPEGLGLKVHEQSKEERECCACFAQNAGHIYVKATEKDKGSEVEVQSYELDEQAQHFLQKL
jgi:hypothetical protein